ncbi:MAG TPA: substrate-binding domain-containing protein [Thermoleophilaceae bacterium]|jgi:molybdate-binding protein|nr:substrate-binding domain-containing protein [Thermoleophilaceae bacterium]
MGSAELAARIADDISGGRWPDGEPLPGVRRLAREAGCSPGTAARAYAALRDRGVLVGSERSRFRVSAGGRAAATHWPGPLAALRLAGSDDPALDVLVRSSGNAACVVDGPRGSVNGLIALARGEADAATLHLLDAASGRWNDAVARGALAGEPVQLVHLWRRDQGLVLAPGNPLGIRGVSDLLHRRIAWRPAGTGSRLLLESLMRSAGYEPRPDRGEPAESHLGVAAAVATGAADAGLAVRAVAESAGLEWIPVATEPFELALAPASRKAAEPLLDVLASASVQERLSAMPGYDLSMSGEERTAG